MSRLLQVIIALAGLAITGILSLASIRSEHLQARHTLMGILTETVSAARATCDGGLADMADDMLFQLQTLEKPGLAVVNDNEDRENVSELLEHYRDYLVELQGSIQGGNCAGAAAAAPAPEAVDVLSADRGVSGRTRSEAPAQQRYQAQAPAPVITEQATANIELRQAEQVQTRAVESQRSRADNGPAPRYYAVLASYSAGDAATYDADRGVVHDLHSLQRAVEGAGVTLKVFRTSVSDHFAIVLEPEGLTRDNARSLVVTARAHGWSQDAFVQAGQSWTECAEPDRISSARDCQADRRSSR